MICSFPQFTAMLAGFAIVSMQLYMVIVADMQMIRGN